MATDSRHITRQLSPAWLRAARRYCVMESRIRRLGLLDFVVLDLQGLVLDSRHEGPEGARWRADELVDVEAVRLAREARS